MKQPSPRPVGPRILHQSGPLVLVEPGSPTAAPEPLTATQLSERWPSSPPPVLSLPIDSWIPRDHAARVIAKANGVDDALAAETGMCFLIAMMRAGLVDARGDEVKLLLEKDRPGADPGVDEEDRPRLQRLRSDLKALGLRAVPEEPTV